MCGIVGYIGYDDVCDILLEGLSKLEYRGYDSAGIAVSDEKSTKIIRATGKLENLYKKINNSEEIKGNTGIGHTRWATHGKPTLANAHPHSSDNFILVHNGIIENEEELKEKYLKGTKFDSQTDTEVIVKLIDTFYKKYNNMENTLMRIIESLKGSYALAIIKKDTPDTIYAVKNKSPLLIGKGKQFNMLASDAIAMISKTNNFFEINDKEFAFIKKDEIQFFSCNGNKITKSSFVYDFDLSDTEKGAYSHYMLKEIEEQPIVIRRILEKYSNDMGVLEIEPDLIKNISSSDKIYIVACGTSYHAGLIGKEFFEKISKKPTEVLIASEFIYNTPILSENPMFIFISQSGETADSRSGLVKVKELGFKSLSITNVKNSTLFRETDFSLLLWAGPEIAVASTKAYIAQIALLAILSVKINNSLNIDLKNELYNISLEMELICLKKEIYKDIANKIKDAKSCFFIGRGIDYFVCLEGALKLKEISYIHTEAYAAGELKHGTIALIENNTPIVAINTQDKLSPHIKCNIKEVKARGANVITICKDTLKTGSENIIINNVNELFSPLLSVIPTQYIAYYTALLKGCDIDKPRNLAKSVTVE